MGSPAHQMPLFGQTRDGGESVPAPAHDDPAALALEIATDLRAAEVAIAGLAAELAPTKEPDFGDRLKEALEGMVKRAEEENEKLRALHAEILGVPVDQLDAKLAEQRAAEDAERAKRKAQRPAPAPRASKRRAKATTSEPAAPPTARLTDRQRELLAGFEVRGNVARFTSTEHQPDWAEVKRVFLALGAKWARGGFRFPDTDDAAEKVRLALESGEVFDPKAAGFFPTPAALAKRLVEMAEIRPGENVLEPSAGRGAIALAAREAGGSVHCFEFLPDNAAELKRLGFHVVEGDFLVLASGGFDAVVMNPPFGGRQDIAHIRRAFECLRPGGRLVSVAACGVQFRDDALATEFRAWVEKHGGSIEALPEGSFIESGTGVRTCVVTARRPC